MLTSVFSLSISVSLLFCLDIIISKLCSYSICSCIVLLNNALISVSISFSFQFVFFIFSPFPAHSGRASFSPHFLLSAFQTGVIEQFTNVCLHSTCNSVQVTGFYQFSTV